MTSYNNNNNISNHSKGFSASSLSTPGSGFGARGSRFNSKRLSVALPPDVASISEHSLGSLPTPRTSRSHLLAGLRTQPKTPAVPASAPYNQTQHQLTGLAASQWADPSYTGYQQQAVPQTATGASFNLSQQYAMRAGQQMYSLPEQVLAPPSVYDQTEGMDPNLLQQLQMTSLFLAQRQQQLQQKLAALSVQGQDSILPNAVNPHMLGRAPQTPQTPQYAQQAIQAPVEVQPGVYLVYNPAIQQYTYAYDQNISAQQDAMSQQQNLAHQFDRLALDSRTPPVLEKTRSFTPPTKAPSPPSALEHVEPLPPPSANAFRRGHKKALSLAINSSLGAADGPKTASAAAFGSQRIHVPQPPMTGTFGPGAARAGEHPMRQPRGPPPLEELTNAPTSKHEGSKNFATRQRRRALDNLMRAGTQRSAVSRSSGGSPVSERDLHFTIPEDVVGEGLASQPTSGTASRKMSPIGSEMKHQRGSQGSADGYFGLSSASSSECEDIAFKQPPTPASPVAAPGADRKRLMIGVLNAAEKRKSTFV